MQHSLETYLHAFTRVSDEIRDVDRTVMAFKLQEREQLKTLHLLLETAFHDANGGITAVVKELKELGFQNKEERKDLDHAFLAEKKQLLRIKTLLNEITVRQNRVIDMISGTHVSLVKLSAMSLSSLLMASRLLRETGGDSSRRSSKSLNKNKKTKLNVLH